MTGHLPTKSWGLHWFRRDLRVNGNPALQWNWKQHEGRVLGVFFFDSTFLERADFSHNRFGFFLNTLEKLKEDLQSSGGDLLVLDCRPQPGFKKIFEALKKNKRGLPHHVTLNRDYEPFARERDALVKNDLERNWDIAVHTERDHLVFEPHEVLKDLSSPANASNSYQVFSPFAKKWIELYKKPEIKKRIELQGRVKPLTPHLFCLKWEEFFSKKHESLGIKDALAAFQKQNKPLLTVKLPEAGVTAAQATLELFSEKVSKYGDTRDFPDIAGTSHFSIYLKNGSLTTSQIISKLKLWNLDAKGTNGETKFLKELIWREFYYSILFHHPRVEHEAFLEKYKNLKWENSKALFKAWCKGETGYPIVDAGMRQLNQTGWMHNRVRMIVASFLTKDLLIDWRWGENYFMKQLLDGDLAPNNGGWQWAASTGCDPQPYFRIFNPLLQSEKFDTDGNYIRKFVPELKNLSAKEIHDPSPIVRASCNYPMPIVEHSEQKSKILSLFKSIA